ncbi:DNA primase [Flammeovirga kamogawensis]|uniref:DNA primase n=1 Tax=Flammeovirga kamogawensis TaxID=373891 RepID=A0ABX8GUG8_9BACT|nr:DNA primase [Flammeovirga kamogawensis]MBB6463901.1 DNA primase [Flammeovirga kamogawensis]QWG06575.1 DNA primase [Flammeovirga kamogawensis]TRX68401.1 DNA primase [Flammeovirga kamogawensis]
MIPQETVEEIKRTLDIVEVVEDFVTLKKKGKSWIGLCPFHVDSSPSMYVTPSMNLYKCFSCGASGDAIKFVQEKEGLNYVESLKYLAAKYGIKIIEKKRSPEEEEKHKRRESIYLTMNYAKDFFMRTMQTSQEGKSLGLGYFKNRGYNGDTINKFDLGYSLDAWDALEKSAFEKGYTETSLELAGLRSENEKGKKYDRFRGRVMFPIHDLSGRVIAFGARTLKKDGKPKYLNSPETEIYHKSDALYGIYHAKDALRIKDRCYLVEGYTDVISLNQSGIENVVASSGTALTEGQIKQIKRFTNNVTAVFDGDAAGLKAAIRGVDMLLEQGLNVRVVRLPEGEDPDSYCTQLGGTKFAEFLKDAETDFILFAAKLYNEEAKNDPLNKAEKVREVLKSIVKIPDTIQQEIFIKECATVFDISVDGLIKELNALTKREIERIEKEKTRARRPYENPNGAGSSGLPPSTPPPNMPSDLPPPPMDNFGDVPPPSFAPEFDIPEPHFDGENGYLPPLGPQEIPNSDQKDETSSRSTTGNRLSKLGIHEEEFIRILLLYGGAYVDDKVGYIYEYLFNELGSMMLEDEFCQQILVDYKNETAMGEVPSVNHFKEKYSSEKDRKTLQRITDLNEEHKPSDEWFKRHRIMIPTMDENIGRLAYNSLLHYKLTYLSDLIDQCNTGLLEAEKNGNDEKMMEALQLLTLLVQQRKDIATELGITIKL